MIRTESFTIIETNILSAFNNGSNTFEALRDSAQCSEKNLMTVLEALIAKGIIKFNITKNVYEYLTPLTSKTIILEGNILMPMSIIKFKDDKILVCRGENYWYEFPADFDTRCIVWNVALPDGNKKSKLVDLIRNTVVKERKSKIKQSEDYKNLQNKIVPYSKEIKLLLNTIGDEKTDVNIILPILVGNDGIYHEFKEFRIRGEEIHTSELIDVLQTPAEERDYTKININRVYNYDDFIFANNCIPFEKTNKNLSYFKISSIKNTVELSFYSFENGANNYIDKEKYDSIEEGKTRILELFKGYASELLLNVNFLIED